MSSCIPADSCYCRLTDARGNGFPVQSLESGRRPKRVKIVSNALGVLRSKERQGTRCPGENNRYAVKKGHMRKRIEDEFTYLPISRQRKYQLRMQRDSRCTECGEPAVQGSRCLKHLVKARERQRKKRGLKRRYYGTLSYKLQAVAR